MTDDEAALIEMQRRVNRLNWLMDMSVIAHNHRPACPHCLCTQTTECCYCDGTRTPLEDS